MMSTQEKLEQIMPSDEKEENTPKESAEQEENESKKDGEDEDGDGSEKTDKHDIAESQPIEKTIPSSAPDGVPKPAGVFNLNNEVVRMRKEVKRLRALIIRKLGRHIAALRKKKGKEEDVERNQRRVARLLEEIHAMKTLIPDKVTKTALQTNLNFEAVCKNPKSTISDRATARIATHPQFQKRIDIIKAAVKAFKIERMKTGMQPLRQRGQQRTEKAAPRTPEIRGGRPLEKTGQSSAAVDKKSACKHQGGAKAFKGDEHVPADKGDNEETEEMRGEDGDADRKAQVESQLDIAKPSMGNNISASITTKRQTQSPAVKKRVKSQRSVDDEESGLESSDEEEKEYFDDSTEERFLKQSSQSEESDDDDFFLGKVSKYKKKKKKVTIEGTGKAEGDVDKGSAGDKKEPDKLQRELDELESRLKSKAKPLASEFCTSLRGSKTGRGRGRGADKFRGRGKPRGAFSNSRDFRKQSNEPMENASGFRSNKTTTESGEKGFASAGRGRGRGRGRGGPPGRGGFTKQAPQEVLHPSWEASKKRKEQQGQILAFQGKKIKFDDD